VGDTDSERAFCWLMQELAKSHASLPDVDELTRTLAELVPQVAQHGTFNFLLSQGDALWAHCSTHLHHLVRQHPFGEARLQDQDVVVNFAEMTEPDDRVAIIATQPLTHGEPWVAMQPGQLLAFVDGLPRG
jgi:glutamine amidotransferase